MSTLHEQIENAFDLSFLQSPEYPATTIKTIGILGGGTAGYLTALALNQCHPGIRVTVIESSRIPVIGVGESTTTEIVPFLHNILEIDPEEFFNEVEPTIKLGIRFDWGQAADPQFNFNFFAGHHYESTYYEGSLEHANWPSLLMTANKLPIVTDDDGELISLLNNISFSYHLDNKKLIRYLNRLIKQRGIEVLDREIVNVTMRADGFVESVQSKEQTDHSFDLFIDCSGFRSKLLGEALKTEFQPFADTLITDRALTFDLPQKEVDCYTSVLTMDHGWCWKIPVRGEDHYGYVHSSQYCDIETAVAEARARFGPFKEFKVVNFRSGRHKLAWNKNVFALGNAYAFIEPLESTAIQTLIHSIMLLCRIMPNSLNDHSSITGLNHEIAATWDTFRWFLGVHYRFNQKRDTPFWQWCRQNVHIGDAKYILDLFKERGPLSAGKFGTSAGYTAFEPLVFNSNSYDALFFGQQILPNVMKAPEMSRAEYDLKVAAYKGLTDRALTQNETLDRNLFVEGGLLTNLFDDEASWVRESII